MEKNRLTWFPLKNPIANSFTKDFVDDDSVYKTAKINKLGHQRVKGR